jgi:hypothetical protein
MNDDDQADELFAAVRALPSAPPSAALSARVLGRAHAALAAEGGLEPRRRPAAAWALTSAVVAAVAVYLVWAVDFLSRLVRT